jgi:hypothetical protein
MSNITEIPAHQLSANHLQQARVWRFLVEGESTDPWADESQVRAQELPPQLGEYASYLLAATFTLKGGATLPGIVQVDILGTQVECTPVAVFANGKSVDPLGRETATRLGRILKIDDAQPVFWQLEVVLQGERTRHQARVERPGALQALGLFAQIVRLHRSRRGGNV